jgi:ElaB/YqjD/DUF883 family membrane-anchored ribosome-binding protein
MNTSGERAMNTDIPISGNDNSSTRHEYQSVVQGKDASHLREELSNLKSDLDALMSHASTLTENELREARDRIMARFSSMRNAAKGMADQASKQFNQGMDVTIDYVRERPLQAVAIAAGIGALMGLILTRRTGG